MNYQFKCMKEIYISFRMAHHMNFNGKHNRAEKDIRMSSALSIKIIYSPIHHIELELFLSPWIGIINDGQLNLLLSALLRECVADDNRTLFSIITN